MFTRKSLINMGFSGLTLALIGLGGLLVAAPPALAKGGWLGVSLQELGPSLREAMDLDKDVEGILIAGVVEGSPAEKAGIREGDVLVSLNGDKVESVDDAVDRVSGLDSGARVEIEVYRDGSTRTLDATLGERGDVETPSPRGLENEVREHLERERDLRRDNDAFSRDHELSQERDRAQEEDDEEADAPSPPERPYEAILPRAMHENPGAFLGVRTFELGDQLAEYFGVPKGEGVLVVEVVDDSPASRAGLHAGDVILGVEGKKVTSPDKLRRLIQAHEPDDKVTFEIQRKGNRMSLEILLGSPRDLGALEAPGAPGMPELPDLPEIPGVPEGIHHDRGGIRWHALPDRDRDVVVVLDGRAHPLRDLGKHLRAEMRELHAKLRDEHLKVLDLHQRERGDRIRVIHRLRPGHPGVI